MIFSWIRKLREMFVPEKKKAMPNKLYVGNLNYATTEEDLKNLFSKYGTVQSVTIIKDKHTGRSKGFGFVEMEEAEKALELNGSEFMGRNIAVSEAKPKKPRWGGEGFGGKRRGPRNR